MNRAALSGRMEVVRARASFAPAVLERFERHLCEAPDEELFRMSPLRYGAAAGLSEPLAIDLFLCAAHAGILDFAWGVLCPACSAFLSTASSLKSLANQRCPLCQLEAPVEDDSVEIAFTVSPSVRKLCYHEPWKLSVADDYLRLHYSPSAQLPSFIRDAIATGALSQQSIGPYQAHTFRAELAEGELGINAPAHHGWTHVHLAEGAPSGAELHLVEGKLIPEEVTVAKGAFALTVHNRTDGQTPVVLMKSPLPEDRGEGDYPEIIRAPYLTAKRLVTSNTFRELFRSQSIPGERGLEFKSLTVLFTDLKGSTELYERVGDFSAFALVREHFDVLREAVATRGGAVVKTIGDAVMASFAEAAAAMDSAAAMRREVKKVGGGGLELKIGLHQGPCIAVESNERLDYFGQTVNIAARVQGVAGADEIACTRSVYGDPRVRSVAEAAGLSAREDRAILKGVGGEVGIYRLA
ncbi:MAG: adenylate/guanylate cyclase domain-containing protein [Myxococcales bacterium]|nr:adenylate/guanylate cyclase domain-containing protein [Myxococcales bacterium]